MLGSTILDVQKILPILLVVVIFVTVSSSSRSYHILKPLLAVNNGMPILLCIVLNLK